MISSRSTTTRRVHRVRHEVRRREVVVARAEALSEGFLRITFTGEALADFSSLSFDDHVKFLFPDASGEIIGRDYTPRSFSNERRELTIEFAMHGEGPADGWAAQAQPGQRVTVGGPRSSMVIPLDYEWHLLVGDAAALPAIHRRLEELPPDAQTIVVIQAAKPDRRTLPERGRTVSTWVSSSAELVGAVASVSLPGGEGFAWAAGEAATMSRLRTVLIDERKHPRQGARIAAYWKRGASAHHENLETPATQEDSA